MKKGIHMTQVRSGTSELFTVIPLHQETNTTADEKFCAIFKTSSHLTDLNLLKIDAEKYIKLNGSKPPVNNAWGLYFLSFTGWKTNQNYATTVVSLLNYAFFKMGTSFADYYILTALEKILAVYLKTPSKENAKYVHNAFKKILDMDAPLSQQEFLRKKKLIFENIKIQIPAPDDMSQSMPSILLPSTMSPAAYLQLQHLWSSIHLGYDRPHANPVVHEPHSEQQSKFRS